MTMQSIRLPPDSSGKRVSHRGILSLPYINGTVAFTDGDLVTGSTSGISGQVVSVVGSLSSGTIKIQLSVDSLADNSSTSENLTVGGLTHAQSGGEGTTFYSQAITIVGANSAEHGQNIDRDGSAYTRFAEGSPALDAFSRIKTASGYTVGYYDFATESQDDLFFDNQVSGGSIGYEASESLMLLATDTTATSLSRRTTNRYHFYMPGIGMSVAMSVAIGDSGKAGNTRAWGMFDSENGLRWELVNSELNVCIRSSTSGGVVHRRVPRSSWNGDRLDGTGQSGYDIDITHRNLYWIEFAWLGVGVVRFGVFGSRGERIICHTFANTNSGGSSPYSQSGSMPLAVESENTATTSSGSEIRWICGALTSEVTPQYIFWRLSDISTPSAIAVITETPVLSIRSKMTYAGKPNRVNVYPETLSVYVDGGPIKLTCLVGATTTGSTFLDASGTIQYDTSASTSSGDAMFCVYLGAGTHNVDLSKYYELTDEGILLSVDGSQQTTSFVATKLVAASTVTVAVTLGYRELY